MFVCFSIIKEERYGIKESQRKMGEMQKNNIETHLLGNIVSRVHQTLSCCRPQQLLATLYVGEKAGRVHG